MFIFELLKYKYTFIVISFWINFFRDDWMKIKITFICNLKRFLYVRHIYLMFIKFVRFLMEGLFYVEIIIKIKIFL